MKKGGLGRGLDALYEDNSAAFPDEEKQDGVRMARLSAIEPNRKQPRQNFDPAALSELAESIRTHGILQPLLVRRVPGSSLDGESYQLVAGERRWRAARMAGLSEVPVVVREMTEEEVLEFALIENLQREDLNPLEEAEGYQRLVKTFGLTQEEVAKKVGRSRSAVANSLRLLKLPMDVQAFVQMGDLSVGHAKALLSVQDEWKQSRLAEKAVQKGLSVRQLEQLCEAVNQPEPDEAPSLRADHYYAEMQLAMQNGLGRRVKIHLREGDKGMLELAFFSKEDLQAIADLLANLPSRQKENPAGEENELLP